MGYIYCIENLINHKKYIGKTLFSVEKRFQRHIIDSRKEDIKYRPLYCAFNKYGIENFQYYTIEKCDNDKLNEREEYWIKTLSTYKEGYNATIGGDGTQLFNISSEQLWHFFEEHKTPKEIASYYGCCVDVITEYSKEYGINWKGHTQRHDIECYYQGEYIAWFHSAGEAAQWLINEGLSNANLESLRINIMRCCKGTRLTCTGFSWKLKNTSVV